MSQHIVQLPDGTQHIVDMPDAEPEAPKGSSTMDAILHKLGLAASSLPKGLYDASESLAKNWPPTALATKAFEAVAPNALPKLDQAVQGAGVLPQKGSVSDKYTDVVARAIGSLPMGGPLGPETSALRAATTAGMAGAGGQVAVDTLQTDNPIVRIAGALAGGGVPAATKLLGGNARTLAQSVSSEITPMDRQLGQQAMDESKALGLPMTIAQAVPNAPALEKVQEALARSGKAPETVATLTRQPAMAQAKVKEAVAGLPGQQTSEAAVNAQTQAGSTEAIRSGYDEAGKAFRKALGNEAPIVPDAAVAPFAKWLQGVVDANPNSNVEKMALDVLDVIKNPKASIKAPKGGAGLLDASGRPIEESMAAEQPKYISDALKLKQAVDDSLEGFGPRRLQTPSVGANESRMLKQIRDRLNGVFDSAAPQVRAANAAYEGVVNTVINPMKEGITGKIAGRSGAMPGVPAANKVFSILDKGTTPGGYSDILTLEKDLRGADKTAFPNAVKTHLANAAAETAKTVGDELNPDFLRSFYSRIFGTEKQQAGLKDQLVGVARSQGLSDNALWPGFSRLINAVGRASKRPTDVSPVTTAQVEGQAGSNPASTVLRVLGFYPFKTAAQGIEGYYRASTFKALDKVMSSPEGIKLLRDLAVKDPMGKAGQSAIISFLGGTENPQPQDGVQK